MSAYDFELAMEEFARQNPELGLNVQSLVEAVRKSESAVFIADHMDEQGAIRPFELLDGQHQDLNMIKGLRRMISRGEEFPIDEFGLLIQSTPAPITAELQILVAEAYYQGQLESLKSLRGEIGELQMRGLIEQLNRSKFPVLCIDAIINPGLYSVALERMSQKKKYTKEHDDEHIDCELAKAALGYIFMAFCDPQNFQQTYPWEYPSDERMSWLVEHPRQCLQIASALLIAEMERIDRVATVQLGNLGVGFDSPAKSSRSDMPL